MGREIRQVPADWEHPRDSRGHYLALYDESYEDAAREWIDNAEAWLRGEQLKYGPDPGSKYDQPRTLTGFAEYFGHGPDPESYRSVFTSEPVSYQVYETVSEGTPVSPVFATVDDMVGWLSTVPMGGVNREPLSRKAAEQFVEHGSAPSFIMDSRGLRTGVEALGDA